MTRKMTFSCLSLQYEAGGDGRMNWVKQWQTNHLSSSEELTKNTLDLDSHQEVRPILPAQATGFGIPAKHWTLKISRMWHQNGSDSPMGRSYEGPPADHLWDLQKSGFLSIQSQPRNLSWTMRTLILVWDQPPPGPFHSSPHNWMSSCIAVGWVTGGECSPPM